MENESKNKPARPSAGSRSESNPDIGQDSEFKKPIDLDDVLVNELGQFGRFQMINMLMVAVPLIMSAFMNEYIFSAAAIPHRSVKIIIFT